MVVVHIQPTESDVRELSEKHFFPDDVDGFSEFGICINLNPELIDNDGVPLFETAKFVLQVPNFEKIPKSFYDDIRKTKKLAKKKKQKIIDVIRYMSLFLHGLLRRNAINEICFLNGNNEKIFIIRSQERYSPVSKTMVLRYDGIDIMESMVFPPHIAFPSEDEISEEENDNNTWLNEDAYRTNNNSGGGGLNEIFSKSSEQVKQFSFFTVGSIMIASIVFVSCMERFLF